MKCEELWKIFKDENLNFFTGVPDSTYKSWMSFLDNKNGKGLTNIIASNECEAIGIAAGYHLATNEVGIAYMQNAGLGKTVNPITSLADKEVYSIPILLMVGWRGEPGKKDEPQHKKMGSITLPLLDVLEIPYYILPSNEKEARIIIKTIKSKINNNNSPCALIVKRGTLDPFFSIDIEEKYELSREEAIKIIINNIKDKYTIVSTTGKTSRELFEIRIMREEHPRDFYLVGSMGCASSISLGIALNSSKKVLILDGDGATLMQMGTLATVGYYQPENLHHIIFDNHCHESTGGQPTVSKIVQFDKIALSCGYESSETINDKKELMNYLNKIEEIKCPSLTIIKVSGGSREDLGRPSTTPYENKESFMKLLQDEK